MNQRSDISPSYGWHLVTAFAIAAALALALFAAPVRAHELTDAQDPNVAGDSLAHQRADSVDLSAGSRYLKMMKRVNRMNRARAKKRLALGLPAQPVEVSDQGIRQRGFIQAMGFDVPLTATNLLDPASTAPTASTASVARSGPSTNAAGPSTNALEHQNGLWSPVLWPSYVVKPGDPDYTGNPNPTSGGSGTTPNPPGNSGDTPANPGAANNPNPRIVPVFEALMPDGKVLYWDWLISGYFKDPTPQMSTRILLWDPMNPSAPGQRLDVAGANLFCAGFAHLPNGDLFLAGGNANNDFHGLNDTYVYHWRTKSWEQGPDMTRLRWYPSVAALYNGEQMILGGDPPGGYGNPNETADPATRSVPEVFSAQYADPNSQQLAGGSIRDLTNIRFGNDTSGPDSSDAINPPSSRGYPFLSPSVDGRVLYAGYENGTYLVDTTGAGGSSQFGTHDPFWRVNGSFVNYNVGKVLLVGGGTSAKYGDPNLTGGAAEQTCSDVNTVGTAQCQPLAGREQENGASPTTTYIDILNDNWPESDQGKPGGPNQAYPHAADMPQPRRFDYSTVLPDGKVLVTGGMKNTDPDNGDNAANDDFNNNLVNLADAEKSALMWDPSTEQFTTLASAQIARQYHSTAMLLPDGRVLTGGGGVCGPCTTQGNHYYNPNFEIFSPPYLFNSNDTLAVRPAITNPTITDGGAQFLPPVDYNQPFDITYTPGVKNGQSQAISTAALLKLGTPTHSTDTGQRFIPLDFTGEEDGVIHMMSPLNNYIAPPGYYMLFLVDDSGTPSISKMIQIGANLSLKNVTSVVNVYQNPGFSGTGQYLGVGQYMQSKGNFANVGDQAISSMQVAPGYQATACTSSAGTGCNIFGPGNYSSLAGGFDNSIRFIKVEPDTGAGTIPTDPTKPAKPKLSIAKKLKLAQKITFKATCVSGCTVNATLTYGKKKLKLKTIKLKASGKTAKVTLKLTKKQYKAIKSAKKKKKKLSLAVKLADPSKQTASATVKFK